MIRFGGLVALVALGFWLYAIFDAISAPRERIRLLPKTLWVIVIVLLNVVGTVLWFVVGRPRKSDLPPARTAAPPGAGGPASSADPLACPAGPSPRMTIRNSCATCASVNAVTIRDGPDQPN